MKAFRVKFSQSIIIRNTFFPTLWMCVNLNGCAYRKKKKLGTTVLEHKHEKSIKSIFYEQPFRTWLLKSPSSLFITLRTNVTSVDD